MLYVTGDVLVMSCDIRGGGVRAVMFRNLYVHIVLTVMVIHDVRGCIRVGGARREGKQ